LNLDAARQRQLTTSPSIPKEIAGEKVLMEELAGIGARVGKMKEEKEK